MEDAIAIIDAIRPLTSYRAHDQEQFAINEALRLHGARITVIHRTLHHYCQQGQKMFMHWRFPADMATAPIRPRRPNIFVNKPIGVCFKWAVRNGLLDPRAQSPRVSGLAE